MGSNIKTILVNLPIYSQSIVIFLGLAAIVSYTLLKVKAFPIKFEKKAYKILRNELLKALSFSMDE
jgi:hypothetical protein